mmetsp:Transcript_127566/g.355076  ORF Transcript_127566/g.355076 Transcript_127566/m.355076 type:complete len:209 (+) Transcript_127566:64-690(+)
MEPPDGISRSQWDQMTPQQRRTARKEASPPSLEITLQIQDCISNSEIVGAQAAERIASLVDARGDVNTTDGSDGVGGTSPLMFAARSANPETLRQLLNAKANPLYQNSNGFTALHSFASRKMPDAVVPEMLNLLLGARCDLAAASGSGLTPLHVAAGWKSVDMCRLLIEKGADCAAKDASGATPYDCTKSRKPTVEEDLKLRSVLQVV